MDNWLSHLKVLDVSNGIGGAFCARLLGRGGAEVLKVEPPVSGDPVRALAPFYNDLPGRESSGLFLYLNSGKRSITLDLTRASGRRIFRRLAEEADVLVESFDPGFMEEMGLGYDELSSRNPGLVQISVSDFGQWGPYAGYKANELIEHAISGLMYPTGFPDQEPVPSGGLLPQFKSGMSGVIAALSALHWREVSGEGQQVDVSMLEVAANFLETTLVLYTYQGVVRGRTGSSLSPPTPLCDMYQTKDGYMIVTSLTQQQRQSLFEMIGHPDLVDSFGSALSRAIPEEVKQTVWDAIGAWLIEQETDEAFELSQLLRIPCAKVSTTKDMLRDQHLTERGFFKTLEHPKFGDIAFPGTGLTVMGEETPGPEMAPALGEANREVYQQRLGISTREMAMLGSGQVI